MRHDYAGRASGDKAIGSVARGVERRLTKPNPPWTKGQVKRMTRTIKDAKVKRLQDQTHDPLRTHLQIFIDAYNVARGLKTLRGLTPDAFICKVWADQPHRFIQNPVQQSPGPYA